MEQKRSEEIILACAVQPEQANAAGNIHGGEIMKMMDNAAGVAAQKYARSNVVTARVNELNFKRPIHVGNLVTCYARVVYTGRSSMEIFVAVEAEDLCLDQSPHVALTAFFTMVALDAEGHPQSVIPLEIPEDPFLLRLYREGERRYQEAKRRTRTGQA